MVEDTVKVRVNKDHFKTYFNLGDQKASKNEVTESKVTPALVAGVEAGTLELVEGGLTGDQKSFREDDGGGEEGVETDEQHEETEESQEEVDEEVEEFECPECEKSFDSERGLNSHHRQKHKNKEEESEGEE